MSLVPLSKSYEEEKQVKDNQRFSFSCPYSLSSWIKLKCTEFESNKHQDSANKDAVSVTLW